MSVPAAAPAGPQSWVRGPTTGQPAGRQGAMTARSGGPSAQVEHRGLAVSWVNAHGGAGASTLTALLGGADLGRRWPDPALGEPGRTLLVGRTHSEGLRAVGRALDSFRRRQHPPGVELLGVVLVADAPGRLPLKLGQRVRVLRSVAEIHRIPWIPSLRLGKRMEKPPKQVLELAELLGVSEYLNEAR
ncbi:DUF6668 family protein [Streptomyces sp. 7N604]|uniref:DUF6668 family protein n=1 Tax=Streptomyces sp. 7N604 TaxID=3457415 RepID=UPI003FD3D9CD